MQELYRRKNKMLVVTNYQEEILTGSLLGDAYITTRGQIQFEQSIHQKEYLFWKHQELSSISYKNVSFVKRFDKRYQHENFSCRFWTRQYFISWRQKYYLKDKKIIPRDIQLTPLSLAIWYMDDGCYSDNKCIIATDGFSQEEICFLQKLLFKKFNIKSSVKNKLKILIKKESIKTFFSLIRPYIISSMLYKISDPVTTSRKRDGALKLHNTSVPRFAR